jgi:uncharacterized protein
MRTNEPPKSFVPWRWNANRHIQTCFPAIFSPSAKARLCWETFNLPDGDFIDCCWSGALTGPVLVMVPGLEGSVESHYIQSSIDDYVAQGWRVLVMHMRGCGGRINRLRRSYHSGDTQDLHFLLQTISVRYPGVPLMLIGFSLGANLTLRYLAEKRYPDQLVAAVGVSIPFELGKTSDYMHPLYQKRLLHGMNKKVIEKMKLGHHFPLNQKQLRKVRTLRQFDNWITSDLYGFRDADDYYQQSSCRYVLGDITLPTFLFHALDDPFIPRDCIPDTSELPPSVQMEMNENGGHVGFITGKPWKPIYWLAERSIRFFREQLAREREISL